MNTIAAPTTAVKAEIIFDGEIRWRQDKLEGVIEPVQYSTDQKVQVL